MADYKKTNSWSLLEQALKEATEIRTPELTVDLPHNQKLTIGQLKPDTIVEIATWTGNGAPDENSVRMLIGASLQNGASIAAENEANIEKALSPVVDELTEGLLDAVQVQAPVQNAESVILAKEPPVVWLDEKQSSKVSKQEFAATEPLQKQTEFQKELGRKQIRKMNNKNPFSRGLITTLGSFLAAALIIAGLNLSGLLAFDHPQVGPELPFGSSTNSLVAIVPKAEAAAGDFAMATLDGKRNFVRVESVSANTYTVATMDGQVVLTKNSLDGKVSFLIPFVGIFWLPFGQ